MIDVLSQTEMMELIGLGYTRRYPGRIPDGAGRCILRIINREFSAVILTGEDNQGQDEYTDDLE